jgi:hypothetical protein
MSECLSCLQAADVDEMLAAHTAYLADIRSRALLASGAQGFRDTLDAVFDAAAQLLHPLTDCEAHVAACAATQQQARPAAAHTCMMHVAHA